MPIKIREVWGHNLESEFAIISEVFYDFPIVGIDAEFPGSFYGKYDRDAPAEETYKMLKKDVDEMPMIQFGLSLCDSEGRFPTLDEFLDEGEPVDPSDRDGFVWQFNFNDFDPFRDLYNKDSFKKMRSDGIDFNKFIEKGVDSSRFANLMNSSRMVRRRYLGENLEQLSWVTFECRYDIGHLMKILTHKNPLPDTLDGFHLLVLRILGHKVYDLKSMEKSIEGMVGGKLENVAERLGINREVGIAHTAGSDSQLTLRLFLKVRFLHSLCGINTKQYEGRLNGLMKPPRDKNEKVCGSSDWFI